MSSNKGIRHLENEKYKAQRDLGASACHDYITSLLLIHEVMRLLEDANKTRSDK